MPLCHASRNELEIKLEVELGDPPTSTLKLAMSLKRHVYKYIHKSESKEANSVLDSTVDVPALTTDAEDIGQQIQAAHLQGPLTMPMDFTTVTQRVYRCDHHRGQTGFEQDGFNHFYPIRGKNTWNCTVNEFDKLQALRRLQKDPTNNGELAKIVQWTAFQDNKAEWIALRKKLVDSSGANAVVEQIEKTHQKRFKKTKANDIFAQAGRLGGLSFSDDDSSGSEEEKKPRNRAAAAAAADSEDSHWSDSFSSSSSGSSGD